VRRMKPPRQRWSGILGFLALSHNIVLAQEWTSAMAIASAIVACSADGKVLLATSGGGGPVSISTNSGVSWTQGALKGGTWPPYWAAVACSADGTKMIAASSEALNGLMNQAPGLAYISSDSGTTWAASSLPVALWAAVASSANGERLFAAVSGGAIYSSSNSGATWSQTGAPADGVEGWRALACSADGRVVVAASEKHYNINYSGLVYVSTNSGSSWVLANIPPIGGGYPWVGVSCSADGTRLAAVSKGTPGGNPATWVNVYPIYLSADSSATWFGASPKDYWLGLACSGSGTTLIALARAGLVSRAGDIYVSSDAGASWSTNSMLGANHSDWISVASSADGNRIVAADLGQIFIGWKPTVSPVLTLTLAQKQAVLKWLTPSMPFVLQQTPSLAQPGWTDVDAQPALNCTNLNQEVALPVATGPMFYRLSSR
jgi:photosystem II stability/assembly factor-like uncharacterized protein